MGDVSTPKPGGRRGFLQAAGAALTSLAATSALPSTPTRAEIIPLTSVGAESVPGAGPNADSLIRMYADLRRDLQKPVDQRRWVMVIDTRKCVGCHACTIACIAENKLPPGVVYRPVIEEEIGTYPNVTQRFLPKPCMQCEQPPCVPVCPVSATYKNADGVVVIDYEQCIGCRYCITACPYASRTFDLGLTYTQDLPDNADLVLGLRSIEGYERASNFEYGKAHTRTGEESPIGNVRKCHFCLHRIVQGMLPECVTTCIGRATMFGDANDPDSLVARLIGGNNVIRLKEEMGTEPRVYYLV